jgi:hypothetical protein
MPIHPPMTTGPTVLLCCVSCHRVCDVKKKEKKAAGQIGKGVV